MVPNLLLATFIALSLPSAGCGEIDSDDVIKPVLLETRLRAEPGEPFRQADVELLLRLEAGGRVEGQTAALEYVRLFEGSHWRTNEPAVELRVEVPEETEEPFSAGETREVLLRGFSLNDDLLPYCGKSLRLLVAIRTSGLRSLLGASREVSIDCGD